MPQLTRRLLLIGIIITSLSACTSVLIGNKAQSMLTRALFKSLVGFDPTEVKLLENPIIKNRMQSLLGDNYDTTIALLNTAQEIQQEGALFYIASRYAPAQVQAITDKAAMVWNADTNQMAVMLIQDGKAQVLSEQIEGAKQKLIPSLPRELQSAYDQALDAQKALQDSASSLRDNAANSLTDEAADMLGDAAREHLKQSSAQ